MYPSATYRAVKARRLKQIRRHACSELIKAYEDGELSLRQFDLLSQLNPRQQRRALDERRQHITGQRTAASIIHQFLEANKEIDLKELYAAITCSVAAG